MIADNLNKAQSVGLGLDFPSTRNAITAAPHRATQVGKLKSFSGTEPVTDKNRIDTLWLPLQQLQLR